MKVALYSTPGQSPRLGVVTDGRCVDLAQLGFSYTSFGELWEAGQDTLEQIAAAAAVPTVASTPLDDVTLQVPFDQGATFWALAANYAEHIKEGNFQRPDFPPFFIRNKDSFVGHGGEVAKPWFSEMLDYEGELVVVIGREARYVSEDDAMDYVAGYTCFNDGSVRDWQRRTSQITLGKNFDQSGALGPWVVTKDDIADIDSTELRTSINGRVVQRTAIGEAIFGIRYVISYLSAATVLRPGDMIALGTPGGVGVRLDPQLLLNSGDQVEITIDGIGTLAHGVREIPNTGAPTPAGVSK